MSQESLKDLQQRARKLLPSERDFGNLQSTARKSNTPALCSLTLRATLQQKCRIYFLLTLRVCCVSKPAN